MPKNDLFINQKSFTTEIEKIPELMIEGRSMSTTQVNEKFELIICSGKSTSSKVNHCLSYLKDDYRDILNNTFFNNIYEYWWTEFYSSSSYYRKLFRAKRSFVCLFDFLYEAV